MFWCLLKQYVPNHVVHLQAKYRYYTLLSVKLNTRLKLRPQFPNLLSYRNTQRDVRVKDGNPEY
jgi:hypothetical protein